MNYRHLLLTAIIALSSNAHAIEPKLEIIEQFDNLKMVSFVSKKEIGESPEWTPGSEAPPLSVEGAIQAVKEFAGETNSPLKVREIEIRVVPGHDHIWHYLIKAANDEKKTKYDIYVVLMNGKVVPAIIEPQSYK